MVGMDDICHCAFDCSIWSKWFEKACFFGNYTDKRTRALCTEESCFIYGILLALRFFGMSFIIDNIACRFAFGIMVMICIFANLAVQPVVGAKGFCQNWG